MGHSSSTVWYGLDGSRAVCDGTEHRWESSGRPEAGAITAGEARVEATVMELRSDSGLPRPTSTRRTAVTLVTA
ncbi:DUF6299 family protein [Streptomyces sp. TRM68367]|uniref:DUF6299 family protein n=1 Tax=Streptomyces sp. TRM68367 TaxID=2758415 RepID=UPI00165BBC97|nr:DUF6299 family protein [Streptomyces sp. TRM68367]MBC9730030.1 hypothetical protein [Streptomyces sp. TRM68367]